MVNSVVYLVSGGAILAVVINRVAAWQGRRDVDAPWHLLGFVLGGILAAALRML